MSVNFGNIHPSDVPVTDLDDVDDDILFNEQTGRHEGEFLDTLDYEHEQTSAIGGFFGRINNYFNKPRKDSSSSDPGYFRVENFEINDEDDDDDTDSQLDSQLRDYKIKRLTKKINHFFLFIIVFIGVLLPGMFYYFHKGPNYSVKSNKIVLSNSTHDFHPTTIIISLDGFHPHYINPKLTPTLHQMMLNDYGAPYMIPSFPSSTFPNHWTLVTGLYPSEHGIVGNTFYDPQLKKQFINTNPEVGGLDPDFWRGGEPIWTTAFKQGVNSAIHMWPGSEVPSIGIGGGGPLDVDRYNGSELLSAKVDRVMKWIDREDINQRPELILTYVPTIDQFGHKFGIYGKNLTDAITYVDDFVDLMIMELNNRTLNDIVNLVIVSDHGMAPTSNDRLLFLDDLIEMKKIEHIDGWPLFGLRPYSQYSVDEIYEELTTNLKNLDEELKHFKIYKVEDIPKEWNFGGELHEHKYNYRLAPIWVIPDVGFSVTTHKQFKENNNEYRPKGVHGYNNTEVLMRAVFLAKGPYFNSKLSAENKRVLPFANTEVYNLLCDSLNIIPAANNGSASKNVYAVSNLFVEENKLPSDWSDNLGYPDVTFPIDHIVNDATYDLLWRPANRLAPTTVSYKPNTEPLSSLISEESSLSSIVPENLPKPTDFEDHDSFDDFVDDVSEAVGDVVDNMQDVVGDVADNVQDVVGDVVEDVQESVDGLYDKIHNWFVNHVGGGKSN